jgi:hypothetical protein
MLRFVTDDAIGDANLTIFRLPEMLQKKYRSYHGRMTDVVAFELPITDEGIELIESLSPDRKVGLELPASSVPGDVWAAVLDALPSDADARFYEADSGRGARGWAVALELAGYVADVFGAGTAAWLSAQGVRRLHQRLAKQMGRRPLISLGTAVFLAAADLSERLRTSEFNCMDAATRGPVPPTLPTPATTTSSSSSNDSASCTHTSSMLVAGCTSKANS